MTFPKENGLLTKVGMELDKHVVLEVGIDVVKLRTSQVGGLFEDLLTKIPLLLCRDELFHRNHLFLLNAQHTTLSVTESFSRLGNLLAEKVGFIHATFEFGFHFLAELLLERRVQLETERIYHLENSTCSLEKRSKLTVGWLSRSQFETLFVDCLGFGQLICGQSRLFVHVLTECFHKVVQIHKARLFMKEALLRTRNTTKSRSCSAANVLLEFGRNGKRRNGRRG
mmetsp:Transcript_1431/g.4473  ORF Transcript_1431/g.4473 Transcript_1431/m.4473 type:complete len:226 (+) Transcript_1431:1651-2328(+)